ncbi:MAG: sporulation protein YunB [Bacilli bacterium]
MRISFLFRTVFTVIICGVTSSYMLSFSSKRLQEVYLTYAKNKSKVLSTTLINEAVSTSLCDLGTIIISEEEVSSYQIDTVNKLIVSISNYILQKLDDNNYAFFEIPMALVYSNPLISHFGPTIPGKMCLLGDVIASSYYSIDPFGINSCLITLYVKVKLNIATYLPLIYESEEIEVDVPLSMNIIEGKIPSTIIGSYSI